MKNPTRTRREFLAEAGGTLGGAWLVANWPAIASAHHEAAAAANTGPAALVFLSPEEARVVEAIAAQIVPTDDTPGAREVGVLFFIDRSLHTWASLVAEPLRTGLSGFQSHFAAQHPNGTFATADSATQIAFLIQVEGTEFFANIRSLTLLGMFASPSYGGNKDIAGWKLLGFEDTHAFIPPFGYYDRDYPGFVVPKEDA
ncbi:MAG TPA: gluconate 2-dehydrogenase subunit 3 family protein [Steroidobacteraceae bacterium]